MKISFAIHTLEKQKLTETQLTADPGLCAYDEDNMEDNEVEAKLQDIAEISTGFLGMRHA
jgi:hypothetical protein